MSKDELDNYVTNYREYLDNFKNSCKTYLKTINMDKSFEVLSKRIETEISIINLQHVRLYDYLKEINLYLEKTLSGSDIRAKNLVNIIRYGYTSDSNNSEFSSRVPNQTVFNESTKKFVVDINKNNILELVNDIPTILKSIVDTVLFSLLSRAPYQNSKIFESDEWKYDKKSFMIGLLTMGSENNRIFSTIVTIFTFMNCFFILDVYQYMFLDLDDFVLILNQPQNMKYYPLYIYGMIETTKIKSDTTWEIENKDAIDNILDIMKNYVKGIPSSVIISTPNTYSTIKESLQNTMNDFKSQEKQSLFRIDTTRFINFDKTPKLNIWTWIISFMGTSAFNAILFDFIMITSV